MSYRSSKVVRRNAVSEEMRERILTAARDLLAAPAGLPAFTIGALARQADVACMTVYYQFGSKLGLLEALCDKLVLRVGTVLLGEVYRQTDPLAALDQFIAVFGGFWGSDRLVIRRLHSLGAFDPELESLLHGRAERRRQHASTLVERLTAALGRPAPASFHESVDVLHTLTSFETFDCLAGTTRSPLAVVPLVQRLARAALGLVQEGRRFIG